MTCLEDVIKALKELEYEYVINQDNTNFINLITNEELIYCYSEAINIKKICCIIREKDNIIVVFRNRKYNDLNRFIKFNLTRETPNSYECNICYNECYLIKCDMCACSMCFDCYFKISKDNAIQCPMCKNWKLDNMHDVFGTPYIDKYDINGDVSYDKFKSLLENLDGLCSVYIFYNNQEESYKMMKNYGENTYKNNITPEYICNQIQNIFSFNNQNIRLLIIRETWDIDVKPIIEISTIIWNGVDIVSIPNLDDFSYYNINRTFKYCDYANDIINYDKYDTNIQNIMELIMFHNKNDIKTITFVNIVNNDKFTFVMTNIFIPYNMSIKYFYKRIHEFCNINVKLIVTCYYGKTNNSSFAAFTIDDCKVPYRIDSNTARNIFINNIDGYKLRVTVKKYL